MKLFEKVKVLDLTRVLAGPYCAMMLADFGADVIKIEPPKVGDDSRGFGPYVGKESVYFMSLNRNKRSITLNLKNPKAKEIFLKMVEQADVVLENYRPGTMEKLGLGYEELRKINPRIIYAACSGFGHTGPYSQKPAYDVIVQGMGGIMSITGQAGGGPTRVGASIGDIVAGLFTAYGVVAALYHRENSGEGQKVDVAMLDCQVAILENAIARYVTSGKVPEPLGNRHSSITPFEPFKARDGYVIIAVGNDNLFKKFSELIGKPELASDQRFTTNANRTENQPALKAELDKVFPAKTVDEWITTLENAGIPAGPINTIDRVVTNEQVKARDMIVTSHHPIAGDIQMPGVPVKMSATPGAVEHPAPTLGQHTDEILKQMVGMTAEQVAALRAEGAL